MHFICSTNDFHCQQINFIFNKKFTLSNLEFVFSNMRFIFNNLRSAFNEMKFIKLKSFTFRKPILDVAKYTSKSNPQNKRSGLQVAHPVCMCFLALFERSLHITELMFKGEVLCFFFTVLLYNKLVPGIGIGLRAWSHACGHP